MSWCLTMHFISGALILNIQTFLSSVQCFEVSRTYQNTHFRELTDQLDLEEDYRNWTDKREVVASSARFRKGQQSLL